MVYFRVRAHSLGQVAASLNTVITAFDTNLSTVNATVTNIAGSTWVGEDADAFNESWADFQTAAASVRLSLTALQAGLLAAEAGYTQTEGGIGRAMNQRVTSVQKIRGGTGGLASRVAVGEERAEDMAEFFGRDYAGDDEVEQFGGGAVGRRGGGGRAGGRSGDTDGDGDDDSIGSGVFLTEESREQLGLDGEGAGFSEGEDGIVEQNGDSGTGSDGGGDSATSADALPAEGTVDDGGAIDGEVLPAEGDAGDGISADALPADASFDCDISGEGGPASGSFGGGLSGDAMPATGAFDGGMGATRD